MASESIKRLRLDLVNLLKGGSAHLTLEDALRNVAADELGRRVPTSDDTGRPYTVWRLMEHIRIAQRDLLDYTRGNGYIERAWPDDYWPAGDAPEAADDAEKLAAFARSCEAFGRDTAVFVDLVRDPAVDPLKPIPHAGGTTLVRNVLVAADHTAYHLGQLVAVRKVLGTWPTE